MLEKIIAFSLKNKLIILLFTLGVFSFGIYSVFQISIGAVPDVTNNQVQVITTSRNLSTQDIEQFITYPVVWDKCCMFSIGRKHRGSCVELLLVSVKHCCCTNKSFVSIV